MGKYFMSDGPFLCCAPNGGAVVYVRGGSGGRGKKKKKKNISTEVFQVRLFVITNCESPHLAECDIVSVRQLANQLKCLSCT